MANLTETSVYPAGIYQIETTDPVLGGAPDLAQGLGITNVPIQQLANRTRFLADALGAAALLDTIKGVDGTGSGLDADLLDGKHASEFLLLSAFGATSRSFGTSGYQIFPSGLILQWTQFDGLSTELEVMLPIAFPNMHMQSFPADRTTLGAPTSAVSLIGVSGRTLASVTLIRGGSPGTDGGSVLSLGF